MSRLNRRLVELGLADSRRKADELIRTGNVSIDGVVTTDLSFSPSDSQTIEVDGVVGQEREDITIAFNKPKGYVCTHSAQTEKQKTIFDLLPPNFRSLRIAGRLDKDSQGLMILSSSGSLIQKISHPSQEKPKIYLVSLDKPIHIKDKDRLLSGVKLFDGVSKFDLVHVIKPSLLRVTMHGGKNRQIRRTFEALGYRVTTLERRRIGKLELGLLPSGKHRFISPREIM